MVRSRLRHCQGAWGFVAVCSPEARLRRPELTVTCGRACSLRCRAQSIEGGPNPNKTPRSSSRIEVLGCFGVLVVMECKAPVLSTM